jgi:hypothetical protein
MVRERRQCFKMKSLNTQGQAGSDLLAISKLGECMDILLTKNILEMKFTKQ